MASTAPKNHWLKDVAAHAGLDLDLPAHPDVAAVRKAWPVVARACGVPEETFTRRVAGHFRVGVADVSTVDSQAIRLIPESVARRYGILPLSATESSLVVATSDPTNRAAHREVVAHASRQPVYLLATPSDLTRALELAYAPARSARSTLRTLVAEVARTEFQVVSNQGTGVFTSFELEDPRVVKLADTLLRQAIRYRADEIHVEPGPEEGRVRYRIDGVLQHVIHLPSSAYDRLVARLKHMAREERADASEEGAAFTVRVDEGERAARLLTTPTPDGELVSLRLRTPNEVPTLGGLGFEDEDRRELERVLARTDGLVLVTGPASSGIEDFVYASLGALRHRKVLSLEGRPQRVVPGVTQVRYEASKGLSFAETLQALLDRGPDVLHAGEIRDLATARIALRTAVTGRKVLTTVHTPDAVSGIRRLVDIGLDPGRLAESLQAVVSLRRVRALCERCRRPFDPEEDRTSREAKLAASLGVRPARRPVGCAHCAGTGYRGQIPLAEILDVSDALRVVLARSPGDAELRRAARSAGMRPFSELARERVERGATTVEEIERVLDLVPVRDESPDSVGPVLVVDDEEQDRLLVSRILDKLGFRVVEAPDGETAIRLLEAGEEDFSLAVLDLYMPDPDGKAVLDRIRRSLRTQSLPVIVLTGSADVRDEFVLLEAGADDYILKPIVAERLAARVRAVLRRGGVRVRSPR